MVGRCKLMLFLYDLDRSGSTAGGTKSDAWISSIPMVIAAMLPELGRGGCGDIAPPCRVISISWAGMNPLQQLLNELAAYRGVPRNWRQVIGRFLADADADPGF